jgi:hypothetical protein
MELQNTAKRKVFFGSYDKSELSKEGWAQLSPVLLSLHEQKDQNIRLNICIALSNFSRQGLIENFVIDKMIH